MQKHLLTFETPLPLDDERCDAITRDLTVIGLHEVEVDPHTGSGHATFEADEVDGDAIAMVLAMRHRAEAVSVTAIAHDFPEEA